MIDSCRPSKLEPGFAATYPNPSVLIPSTMKSDAGCSTIRDRPPDGGVSVSAPSWAFDGAAAAGRGGGSGGCGSATDGWVTSAAAPTAAPLRKPRRSTEPFVDSAIGHSSWSIGSTPSGRREGAYTNRLRTFGAGRGTWTSARGEPFDSPLILSLSKDERLAQDRLVEPPAKPLVLRQAQDERVLRGYAKGPSRNNCTIPDADASRLAALLVAYILPVCALLAPCHAGASTPRTAHLFRDGPLDGKRARQVDLAQPTAARCSREDTESGRFERRQDGRPDGIATLCDALDRNRLGEIEEVHLLERIDEPAFAHAVLPVPPELFAAVAVLRAVR